MKWCLFGSASRTSQTAGTRVEQAPSRARRASAAASTSTCPRTWRGSSTSRRRERRVPVGRGHRLGPEPPRGVHRRREDPVLGLRQRGVRVLRVPPELRRGGVHHHQVLQPGHHRRPGGGVHVHHASSAPGRPARANEYPLAPIGVQPYSSTEIRARVIGSCEETKNDAELERERLRRHVAAQLPGQGVHLVLLRVGRQHLRVGRRSGASPPGRRTATCTTFQSRIRSAPSAPAPRATCTSRTSALP